MKTDLKTYILHLTVEEFIDVLKENIPAMGAAAANPESQEEDGPTFKGRIVYGVIGIERFFNVSHKTACELKKGWLKPAIKQEGRKVMMDAEYALKLYGNR